MILKEEQHQVVFLIAGLGGLRWRLAAQRLGRQIRKHFPDASLQISNETHVYDLAARYGCVDFSRQSNSVTRGYGFWRWKPLLIADALEKLIDSQVLVYIDAGCELNWNSKSRQRFTDYVELAVTQGHMIMKYSDVIEKYCKRYALERLLKNESEALTSNMVFAGFLMFTKTGQIYVREWANLASRSPDLFDDCSYGCTESEVFIAHRHDQAVLAALVARYDLNTISDESDTVSSLALGRDFPVWAIRNRWPFNMREGTFMYKMRRLWWALRSIIQCL